MKKDSTTKFIGLDVHSKTRPACNNGPRLKYQSYLHGRHFCQIKGSLRLLSGCFPLKSPLFFVNMTSNFFSINRDTERGMVASGMISVLRVMMCGEIFSAYQQPDNKKD